MVIALILAFLIGVFSVLLLEGIFLYKWWTSKPEDDRKLYPKRTKVTNPKFIADYIMKDGASEEESCLSLNFLLAFLWREWRDSPKTKSFLLARMNSELTELIKSKAVSKVIEQITIDELSLGTSLPIIKGATVMKIDTKDPKEVPQELDIALDLEYSGGCHIAMQVDLVFNKSVYLAVKLVHLQGRARLQFRRHPLAHWSFAFYEEPEVEFQAESQFEGKNLPQLTSLITNHLRKSIQKKHTLPNYKVRYNPFFEQPSPQDETQEVYVHDSLVTVGALDVTVMGCTRLPELENWAFQYCTLSVDMLPWGRLAKNRRAMWPTFEVTISRETNDISFGLTLKEVNDGEFGKAIVIQTIVTDSPAYCAGIIAKDIFLAIDGHKTDSLKQAAKMIKNKNKFTATVQRPPTRLTQQLNQDVPDKELGKTVVDYKNVALDSNSESEDEFVNIVVPLFEHADREMAKSAVQEMLLTSTDLRQQAKKKLKLKQGEKVPLGTANTESGVEAKPTGTGDQVRRDQRAIGLTSADEKQDSPRVLRKTSDQVTQDVDKKVVFPSSTNDSPAQGNDQVSPPSQTAVDGPDHVKTRLVPASVEPVWSETVKFDILQGDQYLNVCIWCKFQDKNEKDALLGYISIPLMDIAWQCLALSSKRHEQCYMLVSPHSDRVISNMPYLRNNPSLKDQPCCGDVTLIFRHTPSLADCDEAILEKADFLATSELKNESQLKDTLESLEPPKHQFSLTQFHFPTRCSYCNKKVWTKVAFQCRICAMICHKKCLQSCMRYTHCIHETKSTPRWFSKIPPKPGKNKTKKKKRQRQDCSSAEESIAEGSSESELDRNIKKTEKCPDKEVKKQSGANDCDQTETSNEVESGSREQTAKASEDEWIMQADNITVASERVREAGRELFSNLPLDARKSKLDDMMNKLQVEIDEESETRTELYEKRSKVKDKKQKIAIESLLEKSEERGQALAMLMLQYCSGYQSCVEAEESDRYQL
ncbi:PDZ domain-containing protein 8-like [Acropora millepora]|uniref:PDZ domain-containing protein 8-like n=1 Tax=Acropora millepora TaxID=45264 RepID=UPI001CF369CF|nr:PDZ domain-containing protein 8-like [Acropora millepora]